MNSFAPSRTVADSDCAVDLPKRSELFVFPLGNCAFLITLDSLD